ncbi:hypothetical protein D3C76_1312000 [compost metagenome]
MQEHHVRRRGRQLQAVEVQAVVAQAFRQVVGQGQGKQLAHPLHGMLPHGHRQGAVIEAAGPAFTGRVAIQPSHRCLDQAGQPG